VLLLIGTLLYNAVLRLPFFKYETPTVAAPASTTSSMANMPTAAQVMISSSMAPKSPGIVMSLNATGDQIILQKRLSHEQQ
jgi:hypothetical protein